jgi:hypothetical protein
MSGYSGDELAGPGGLPQGAFFVQKPFSVESLVGKIREAMG